MATPSSPATGWFCQPSRLPDSVHSPSQKNTTASPAITWFTRSVTTNSPNSSDTTDAASIATGSASSG